MSSLKDSIPPHNQEAEQALLGALLLDWSAMPETAIFIKADQFYSIQNQLLYSALLSLYNQNIRGDTLTLINQLTKDGTLDKAGGASYIAELTNVVPTAANIKYYAEIIKDHAKRRELIKISNELKLMAVDESRSSKLIIEEAEKKIFALATETQESSVRNMKEVIGETTDIIEKQARNKDFTGIPTGFAALDELTDGFQESDLIIIGARPSIGKTALALSMMEYITVDRKIPCGFFSLEMAYTTIGKRLISQVSQIGAEKIRRGNLRTVDFSKMLDAAGLLYEAPLYIADTPNMRLLELRALARRLVSNNNVKIIFIDYIGLITTENESAPVHERVSEISKSLKALARELKIPIVALSQVGRDAEGNSPNLAQIRGSGSVEQDADVVLFIERERYLKEDEIANNFQEAKINIAKQRNGSVGKVKIGYKPTFTKFVPVDKE